MGAHITPSPEVYPPRIRGLEKNDSKPQKAGYSREGLTSTKSFATAGALNSIACAGKSHVKCTHFFSRDADHQCVMYNSNDLHAPQNSSLNNKALKNVGRKWYAWFVIKNKSLCRKRILVSFAEATQPFRPRPKILRFLLGLRRSSSCGRDCADGAVGTGTQESGLE